MMSGNNCNAINEQYTIAITNELNKTVDRVEKSSCGISKEFCARLVELVDTSDLKSDSIQSIGSIPITSNFADNMHLARMMELVDMLGLGSSSSKEQGFKSPFW